MFRDSIRKQSDASLSLQHISFMHGHSSLINNRKLVFPLERLAPTKKTWMSYTEQYEDRRFMCSFSIEDGIKLCMWFHRTTGGSHRRQLANWLAALVGFKVESKSQHIHLSCPSDCVAIEHPNETRCFVETGAIMIIILQITFIS